MKPIDHCFTIDRSKQTIFEPPRFTKFSMPVIRPPWYRRLWRWFKVNVLRRRELSLREVLTQNSMKV